MFPFPSPLLTVARAVAAATWHVMRAMPSRIGDDPGWNGYTLRLRYTAAQLTDVLGATQARIVFQGPGTSIIHGVKIAKAYIGLEGGSNFAFNGSQVQLLWGGSASVTVEGSFDSHTSDGVAIAIDGTAAVVVAFFFTNDANYGTLAKGGSGASAYKLGDDAATTAASGYTTTAVLQDTTLEIDALA